MKTRLALTASAILIGFAVLAEPAAAHGLVTRYDLPIPEWLFAWAAAVVLIVSFGSLAVLWPKPKLEGDSWRPLPGNLGRLLASPPLRVVCGVIGVLLLLLVVWSGFAGVESPTDNFAPIFIYIIFWVGLVPVSVLCGDVFRAFNPWGAAAHAVSWIASAIALRDLKAPFSYPAWLGRWPAAVGIFGFAWLEIVSADGAFPDTLALATVIYSVLTFAAMAAFGIDAWLDRGEAFSVYFNLFSRISVFERRADAVGLRAPLSGLTKLEWLPGTVALLVVMIGTVTFDGASGGATWQGLVPDLNDFFDSFGFDRKTTLEATFAVGLIAAVTLTGAFYRMGIAGVRTVGGNLTSSRLAALFVHSLVPIAFAYVMAHYVSFLVLQGQAIAPLASDPLGRGWDLFGTADWTVDYGTLSANTFWYIQVAVVVIGHVAALTLAHDRALVIYDRVRLATQSQYWLLGVMVGFTTLALWLLSEQNKG